MSVLSINHSDSAPLSMPRGAVAARSEYQPVVHGLAVLLVAWAFLVVCVGGLVKSSEAGLSIPQPFLVEWHYDWLFVQRLNAEYGHRALVGVMSGLTVMLTAAVIFKEQRRSVRKLAAWLIVVLFAQAFLGYLTVKYFAHAKTSIPHAVLGQGFLCLAVAMAAVTSRSWMSDAPAVVSEQKPSLRRLAVYAAVAVGVQLLLGAALRHDDEGLAMRSGRGFVFVWHLVAHIAGAFTVVYFLFRLLSRVFHNHREQPEIMWPAKIVMMLLGLQFLLGPGAAALKILTLEDYNNPPLERILTATVHLGVGALILSLCVLLALRAFRFTRAAA